ncbi:hypothetical protein EDC94DRAFT_606987 [Helicostylum pulchrum]|nr:hypothetical protein EDC94DRAFT_606987 [Helicostylum pulchrum]
MKEVYDLHRYTRCAFLHMGREKFNISVISNSARSLEDKGDRVTKDTCIMYDKQKTNILSWGDRSFEYFKSDDEDFESDFEDDYEDGVQIDRFKERLYQVFKKDKDTWSEEDLFLLKAVSDFLRLLMEGLIEESRELRESGGYEEYDEAFKDVETLHYIFVVPSEWEEEIREVLLRPMLVQADLISKNDHKDRLLFCSELESICYYLTGQYKVNTCLERGNNTIVCTLSPVEKNAILIKLDLVSTVNSMFDFSGALLYPKIARSNSLSLTINNITDGIRAYIETELPYGIQEEIVQIIMGIPYQRSTDSFKEKGALPLWTPLITDTSKWELDKHQEAFMGSICLFNICKKIGETMSSNIKDLLLNNLVKEYNILIYYDKYSSGIYINSNLTKWSNYMLEYNRISFNAKNIIDKSYFMEKELGYHAIESGAFIYVVDVIRNSDISSKPRILPEQNSTSSSSIFLTSKPGAIMSIDISIESTLLSFSFLDENGFVKESWNNDYFLTDISLRSMGSFFRFSEITTLNVKDSFTVFAEEYLMSDISSFSDFRNIEFSKEIENILCEDSLAEDPLVSVQQHIYIKTFVLLYMTYIKDVISSKLSGIVDPNTSIQIGYAVTIEKLVLSRLFDTEEGLQDVIYASGLIQRNDNSKKLRVIRQEKQLLPLIQQSLELEFPLKSFFVVARFYESYVQLTQSQVVTEYSLDDDQEVIIIQDKIIHIPNIYDSLCLNMWNNIVEDNSLIQLCDTHREYNENGPLKIFTLENQVEFTNNLKQYISENNLCQLPNDKYIVQLSVSCNCKVCLMVNDIVEISFRPVLQDITSLLSASLINKEFFGKYWNIRYVFQLIHFNYNTQLQDAVMKMTKEITEDIMVEQEIDIPHYVIPKILDQRLQPVHQQRSFLHKEFQVGALNQVYSDNFGFSFYPPNSLTYFAYRSKGSDTKINSVDEQTIFLLFKKGDKIGDYQTNRICYLYLKSLKDIRNLRIKFFKLKTLASLKPDGTVDIETISELLGGPCVFRYEKFFEVDQDIPIIMSIVYDADVSSFSFNAKLVGDETDNYNRVNCSEPMALGRF